MDLDVMGVASATMALRQQQVQQTVQMSMLRKGLDQQEQAAKDLLQTLPNAPKNPSHLGNKIDFTF